MPMGTAMLLSSMYIWCVCVCVCVCVCACKFYAGKVLVPIVKAYRIVY